MCLCVCACVCVWMCVCVHLCVCVCVCVFVCVCAARYPTWEAFFDESQLLARVGAWHCVHVCVVVWRHAHACHSIRFFSDPRVCVFVRVCVNVRVLFQLPSFLVVFWAPLCLLHFSSCVSIWDIWLQTAAPACLPCEDHSARPAEGAAQTPWSNHICDTGLGRNSTAGPGSNVRPVLGES